MKNLAHNSRITGLRFESGELRKSGMLQNHLESGSAHGRVS